MEGTSWSTERDLWGHLKCPTPSNKTYKNDSIYKNLFPGWLTKINNNYVPHYFVRHKVCMCIYVYICSYHCFDISNALKCIVQASISHFYEDLIEQNNHIYICITGHLTHVVLGLCNFFYKSATCTSPVIYLLCPPKFWISINVFNFSWDDCKYPQKSPPVMITP